MTWKLSVRGKPKAVVEYLQQEYGAQSHAASPYARFREINGMLQDIARQMPRDREEIVIEAMGFANVEATDGRIRVEIAWSFPSEKPITRIDGWPVQPSPAVPASGGSPTREGPSADALREALKTYGQHRVGCPHPSCPDCGTHTMAASKTPGYSYCTRCGCGSIPTRDEACDCGFEASLSAPSPQEPTP